jgi:hypothetical protein
MQLAEAVEAFVGGSVHPIADAIGTLFREQVKWLLIRERPADSASALALVGRTKRAIAVARRALIAQAGTALAEQRVLAQASGLEREFLEFTCDSIDTVLTRCRAEAAEEIRPVLERVFLDVPIGDLARAVARQRARLSLRLGVARLGNTAVLCFGKVQQGFAVLSAQGRGRLVSSFSPLVVAVTARSASALC